MNFHEYQDLAHTTSLNTKIGNTDCVYPILGLSNEVGEVCGKIKKLFRDKNGIMDDEFKQDMISELGDVLWYLTETCTQLKINLEYVAAHNLSKLANRKSKGTIQGSGDNR